MNGLICNVHLCTVYMQCPQRPEGGVMSSGTQLQVVVNHHVGTGNSVFLEKSSQCCYHLNHRFRPERLVLQQIQQYYFWKPDFCLLVSLSFYQLEVRYSVCF